MRITSVPDTDDDPPGVPLVAATKVRPPRLRAETVARARVHDLVARGAEGPLTVLSAPAGAGKTTALLEWVETAPWPVAWVSLDAADDEPRRLWEHVLAALDRVVPGAVEEARTALRAGADLQLAVAALTVNALDRHAAGGVAIVLDDYHHIRADAAHRSVIALLDAAPAHVHLVIGSRTEPPLRLGRRRAAGTAVELKYPQLIFTPGEAAELLNDRWGLGLDAAQLAVVDERIAGCPAGLALVARTLAEPAHRSGFGAGLTRAEALLDEYLAEEILDPLEPELRELLVCTAVTERFTLSLCEAVLDHPDARAWIHAARRSNLLVHETGDGADAWYRYPDRFAQLLREELAARPRAFAAELHARASRWFERAGLGEQAITHASLAGDGPRAARLLRENAATLLGGGCYGTTRRLVEAMPAERGEYGPFAEAAHTLALQMDGAEPSLVYERWQELQAYRDAPDMARIADAASIWPFFGRVGEAVEQGRRVYERDPGTSDRARHSIAGQLGLALWFAGERAEARAVIERHLGAMVFPGSKSLAYAVLAFDAAEDGNAERALARAGEAVAVAAAHGGETALQYALAYQAQADALRVAGRLEEAVGVLGHVERVTARHPGSLHHALSLILRAELHVARHARDDARRIAAEAVDVLARYPDVGILGARLGAVQSLLAQRADDGLLGSAPTAAERRVLELLAEDRTLEAIARELFVSVHTVKSHTRRLYRRLGARNRAEALAAARARDLLV